MFCNRPFLPPWPLWGWFGEAKPGGFRRQSLRNFLPIPSSLFTKKPSPFHMGSYFGKVPPVESLSQKSEIFASSLSQGSLRAVPADNFGGESPLTMRTGIFCESLLPLQCPVSLLRWRWICRPKPPLPKVVLPLAKPGGFRGSQVSTWVCAFGKCLP